MTLADKAAPIADWPAALQDAMASLPSAATCWIAFSGGLDSTVLLNLCVQWHRAHPHQWQSVRALHINHQLQPNAEIMAQHCQQACVDLDVTCVVEQVRVTPSPGEGVEAAARKARYRVFRQHVQQGDLLLMAHHADDQAETVLFRLLRGAGPRGLAGIPRQRAVGAGQLCRPLLGVNRDRLQTWAAATGLKWIDDPSNLSDHYDRNFLRLRVMPLLRQRWPSLTARLARSAGHCDESQQLADQLARLHYQQCATDAGQLQVSALAALAWVAQKNLLRWWLAQAGFTPPANQRLQEGLRGLMTAAEDRQPRLDGDGYSIVRYRGLLCIVSASSVPLPEAPVRLQPNRPLAWPGGYLLLDWVGAGPPIEPAPPLMVMRREGGERAQFHPGGPRKTLKHWLQDKGIPPWERDRLALVWQGENLVAIGGLWVAAGFQPTEKKGGWRLSWRRDFD